MGNTYNEAGYRYEDSGSEYESLAQVRANGQFPYEGLVSVAKDASIPWESLVPMAQDASIPYEILLAVFTDGLIPYESLAPLAQDATIPYETIISFISDHVLLWESLGGMVPAPFLWRLELRDTNFNLVDVFEPDQEAHAISWSYRRIGGCATLQFQLNRPFDQKGTSNGNYDVQLLLGNPITGVLDLWYRGFIQQISPTLDEPEQIEVLCVGYGAQLGFIRINKTYSAQETMEAIVTDIIQTFVAPDTKILFDAALIEPTGISLGAGESLAFDTMAGQALQTVADIVGTREWGVGIDRKFFFKARNSAIRHRFFPGHDVAEFEDLFDYSQIKNRLILKGGGTPPFETQADDTASQTQFGLREEIVSNTAITSNPTGQNYLAALLAEKSVPVRRSSLDVGFRRRRLEEVVPVGKISVVGGAFTTKYGGGKYGAFKYGGEFGFQLQGASYALDDAGVRLRMDLGKERPSVAEQIGKILFDIEQLQQNQ